MKLQYLPILLTLAACHTQGDYLHEPVPQAVPDTTELRKDFGRHDEQLFRNPSKQYRPETWFHYVNGNVDREGITADLEAIAQAGIAGVQFFHGGGFADNWKGVKEPVYCLSEKWEDLVHFTACEAQRLRLRFTMQNCPGWSMSGGPWIDLDHTMRNLAHTATQIQGGTNIEVTLPAGGEAAPSDQDYRDLMVLAFRTPLGEGEAPLWTSGDYTFEAPTSDSPMQPHVIDIRLPHPAVARTLQTSSINGFQHAFCCNPDVHFRVEAIDAQGTATEILSAACPNANWQDSPTMSYPLTETTPCSHYRITIHNKHPMNLGAISLLAAARQPNWEAEAGWTARTALQIENEVQQSTEAYVSRATITDITDKMGIDGTLHWEAPEGNWTVLRIGHVNTQRRNGPAPKEATGWECNKLDPSGADLHFDNYIGKYTSGSLQGLVSNMLLDSWECVTQTWTQHMPSEFLRATGYNLLPWMPALFGYVLDNPEITARFLCDWRVTLNDLYVHNFFDEMATKAHEAGITCSYETAAGDILPADPLEYYKYADVPMCEFWQPYSHFLYNREFKPIRPTASAAHLYGKPRVSAESFTSFDLTWDEHWQMFKDVANQNLLDGMTHFVFHTYTHNPGASDYFPGTSFGSGIGSPFLRGQTWWRHMPAFTGHLARCTYMLERGLPVMSVLWYLGDEPRQKPLQLVDFPEGYHFDYCNPDALLTRLHIEDGAWTTPDGIAYPILWIPTPGRMHPETLERLQQMVEAGGILVADRPTGLATLSNDNHQQQRYDDAVATLWPRSPNGIHIVGQGKVVTGMSINEALQTLQTAPDVVGLGKYWFHRRTKGADWYFVCPPAQETFAGDVTFHNEGYVELWNPANGSIRPLPSRQEKGYSQVHLEMAIGQCLFIVFRHDKTYDANLTASTETACHDLSANTWQVTFPAGWGIDAPITTTQLLPWKDLDVSDEGRAFSGTATYTTTLNLDDKDPEARYMLQLGRVNQIAMVRLGGQDIETLWSEPYTCDITSALRPGSNTLEVDVTSSWYNRLVYDASLPEDSRKTWVIAGPQANQPYKSYGLFGPVTLSVQK